MDNLPDKHKIIKKNEIKTNINILKHFETFKFDLKLNYKHIFLINILVY